MLRNWREHLLANATPRLWGCGMLAAVAWKDLNTIGGMFSQLSLSSLAGMQDSEDTAIADLDELPALSWQCSESPLHAHARKQKD